MAKKQRRAAADKAGRKKKKKQVSDPNGMAFIKATLNNVLVSVTDANGNVLQKWVGFTSEEEFEAVFARYR